MRPINLMPRAAGRSPRRGGRGGLVASILVVALFAGGLAYGVYYWDQQVAAARDDLQAQLTVNRALEDQVLGLADASELRSSYEERAAGVRDALESDVDWGRFLNDLARFVPNGIDVTTFSGIAGTTSIEGALGTVSFSGSGSDFPDVAEWLRTLASEDFDGVTGPWVSQAARGSTEEGEFVDFTSTAVLTPNARSGRLAQLLPEVPE